MVSEHSPLSPEARAHDPRPHPESEVEWFHHLDPWHQAKEVVRRVVVGVYSDGFVHAGNFAYLSIVALFAFCIVAAAIAGSLGQTESGLALIDAFFKTVPNSVEAALEGPVHAAMSARSGPLLWLSAIVSLWTTTSLIETIRDVLHRAYGTQPERWFWQYRLGSFVVIVAAVILAMMAFSAQVLVVTIEDLVYRFIPAAERAADYFAWAGSSLRHPLSCHLYHLSWVSTAPISRTDFPQMARRGSSQRLVGRLHDGVALVRFLDNQL